jgi:hypothetical protein
MCFKMILIRLCSKWSLSGVSKWSGSRFSLSLYGSHQVLLPCSSLTGIKDSICKWLLEEDLTQQWSCHWTCQDISFLQSVVRAGYYPLQRKQEHCGSFRAVVVCDTNLSWARTLSAYNAAYMDANSCMNQRGPMIGWKRDMAWIYLAKLRLLSW